MGTTPSRRCVDCGRRAPGTRCGRCAGRHDRRRGTAHQRGYTARWAHYSRRFLVEHPRCGDRPPEAPVTRHSRCAAEGRPVPAEVTDHITPHRGDPALFWSRANHQALCKPCHDRKTATEDTARPVR